VQPHGLPPKRYAVVADGFAHAQALVGNYCKITNEKVEAAGILTDREVEQLALKRGEVKLYD
jgi:hypothetical protein